MPISIAIGISPTMGEGRGGGVPAGYATMRALNDSAAYVNLLIKGDDGVYRNLFGKAS